MSDREWFIDGYDQFVNDSGSDGAELEKSRDALAHQYADAVEQGRIDRHQATLVEEGRTLFSRYVERERNRRSRSVSRELQYLLDAMRDQTVLGRDDPRFTQAVPLGESDGRDKTLGLWSPDEWVKWGGERRANGDAAKAAGDRDDRMAKEFAGQMIRMGVTTTREVFQ